MLAHAGYTITERVSERRNVNVIVHRGYSDSDADKKPLLFKLLKPVNAHPANRALVQSEYEIIKDIESDGIVKAYGIIDSSAGMVLVSEDFEGVPLNTFQNNGPIDEEASSRRRKRKEDSLYISPFLSRTWHKS